MGKGKKQKSKLEFTEDYRPIRKVPIEIKNNAPKEVDDTQSTRKLREIQKLKEVSKNPIKKKRSKPLSALLQVGAKSGFTKRRGETEKQFKKRILRETSKSINEDVQKVRYGLAGRDINEIKAEYKEIDEKAKKQKAMKVLLAERKKKQKEKHKKPSSGLFSSDDEDDSDNEMGEDETDNESESEEYAEEVNEKSNEKQEDKKKKLTKNEKLRLLKKEQKKVEDKEKLLDAKEIIPFGARVDAPPQFKGKLKKLSDPSSKAGSKNLLLKNVLQNNNQQNMDNTPNKKQKVDEEERQKVIQMYRQLKKTKKL